MLKKRSKEYKKELNLNYKKKHQEKCANELDSLSKSDPKAFWNTLNKVSTNSHKTHDIPIDTLYHYFKTINANTNLDTDDEIDGIDINELCEHPLYDNILNGVISETITKLKNNKAPGPDGILNEYLKNSSPLLIPIYFKLFNIILDTGILPGSWTLGIIKPIYKNKGNQQDPDNYRAITLISCIGKLFTAIINNRLKFFAIEINLINRNQAGFRKGHSTSKYIYCLHFLISLYLSFGKKKNYTALLLIFEMLCVASGLWRKLQKCEIKGKCFKIIFNLYRNIKSCVEFNNKQSEFFTCVTGVRQGGNVSPFLFSIFSNFFWDLL